MEALAAFGIACNVMQTISFGLEVLSTCRRISDQGTPQPDLETNSDQLRQLSSALLEKINEARVSGTVSKEQRILREVASNLNDTIAQMVTLLDDIKMRVPSRLGAIKSLVKYMFRYKRKIEKLEKAMQNYQSTLNSGILVNLCSTTEANALLSRQDFSKLDSTLQKFIQNHVQDTRNLTDLVSKESTLAQVHVTAESVETRRHVTENLQLRTREQGDNDRHARLLNSLKFEEMNARSSAVTVAHTKTFEWIFDDSVTPRWDSFPQWLNSRSKDMYWISGKAGSGKSTLMKFIIGNDATKKALIDQEPHARILSYFFWTSGTKMQRSIKGMLSSLLHQLLREEEEMIFSLSKQYEKIQHKDSIHDWSVEELEHTLLEVLSTRSQIRCLFIDGLDEVDFTEGQDALIRLLERVRVLPNVKLCVSSRPETVLQQSLEIYPKLRVQDLTKKDIRCLVQDTLDPTAELLANIKPLSERYGLVERVSDKADGVFLWAALVSKSLYRGIKNGDTWETLLKRLDILSGDMNDLYRHMWSRLNEDKPLYQEQAANYFAYFLHASDGKYPLNETQSLYKVTVASERSFDNHVFQENASELLELCESVANRISVRCAGMLEVNWYKDSENATLPAIETSKETWRTLGVHPTRVRLSFIHRSAKDFLRDTKAGKEILSFGSKSDEEIYSDLVRAYIAQLMIFDPSLRRQPRIFDIGLFLEDEYGDTIMIKPIVDSENELSQDTQFALLHLLRKHFEQKKRGEPSLIFTKLIAYFGLSPLFWHLIRNRELQYHMLIDEFRNQLLQCAAYRGSYWRFARFSEPIFILGKFQLIAHFLEAGADPNLTFRVRSLSHHDIWYCRTALSSTLKGLFMILYKYKKEYDATFYKLLAERLQVFLTFSPNFRSKILLFCSWAGDIQNKIDILPDHFELNTTGPFVAVQVNCAWLWRGLMEILALQNEQTLVTGDESIEPELEIVGVFLTDTQRLAQPRLEELASEHRSLGQHIINQFESGIREILSGVGKRNQENVEGGIVIQEWRDWSCEEGYMHRLETKDSESSDLGDRGE